MFMTAYESSDLSTVAAHLYIVRLPDIKHTATGSTCCDAIDNGVRRANTIYLQGSLALTSHHAAAGATITHRTRRKDAMAGMLLDSCHTVGSGPILSATGELHMQASLLSKFHDWHDDDRMRD
jgi:hypothetical protein